jgi:signal transduction histidine kinase/DNA-binding response OmpR family regulator/ligand-binding sensor domain-containing protein
MNHKIKSTFFSIFFIAFSILPAVSQDSINFNKIGLQQGLNQLSVLSIHQDHLNRMWFGTRSGLNMWDGERMQTFSDSENNKSGLPGYDILKIVQKDNFLWLLSLQNVVCRLNLSTMEVERYTLGQHRDLIVHNNKVLVSSVHGLYEFDETNNKFFKTLFYKTDNQIIKLYADKGANLWLYDSTENKIIKLNSQGELLMEVLTPKNINVTCLLAEDDELLLGTRKKGIVRWNFKTNVQEYITSGESSPRIPNNSVYSILKYEKSKYWVATLDGLSALDLSPGTSKSNNTQTSASFYLKQNAIVSLFVDDNQFLWAGSYFGGVYYSNLSSSIYKKYKFQNQNDTSLLPIVGEMVSDTNNNLWIGTEGGGLLYLDKKKIQEYKFNKSYSENYTFNIKSLCTTENHLLIGKRDGGIGVLNLKTGAFEEQKLSPDDVVRDPIHAIVPYKNDFLLAASHGLVQYNMSGSHKLLISPEDLNIDQKYLFISSVLVDKKGIVWFGVKGKGLFSYDEKNNLIKDYSKKSDFANPIKIREVNYLFEDNYNQLWVGTNGEGLLLLNKKDQDYSLFNTQNSNISSNFIYGIVESRFGNMWVSTRNSLSRLDVKKKTFFNHSFKFGFPLTELNLNSIFLNDDGELFVGGVDGLISFNEEELIYNHENPKVIFTSLNVNNKDVSVNDKSKILTAHISETKELTLQPNHTSFKLSFSSCNYNSELKNNYEYMLEGFNNDWINTDGEFTVAYTNLSHGKYTLLVRATDTGGFPISETASLSIIVNPPLTKTWYAYLFYILLITALIILINKFYLKQIKLVYQIEAEKTENKRIQDLNLFKLKFFTNVSHEFMTPLTMILNATEHLILKEKVPNKLLPYLQQAYRNSKRLKNLNRELLDFRKIEQGHLKLSVQKNNIVDYINEVFETFKELAEEKSIEYKFNRSHQNCMVYYDTTQMNKVFFNLLSNAFNYTNNENGKVVIDLVETSENVSIKVTDNGKGIPKEEIHKVFDRFYRSDKKTQTGYGGSGIGLALAEAIVKAHDGSISCSSEIGNGATFSVVLKKGKSHFQKDEISDDTKNIHFLLDKDLIPKNDFTLVNKNSSGSTKKDEQKLTVLVVEDNVEIQSLIHNLLIDRFNVELANNGEEGLQKALQIQPDIIISDIMMPDLSGDEMCEKLKRNISTSHIPIIILTALSSDEDRVLVYKSGADAYITKPFSSETLIARIENIFNSRNKLQAIFKKDLNTPIKSIVKDKVDQAFIEKAEEICEKNMTNFNYDVTEFAREMGMSRTLFFSKIKTITGQTPNDFIKTLRLKKAAKMISSDTTKNISEIAYEVGFNSPNYFSKCFKTHFGISPKDYGN